MGEATSIDLGRSVEVDNKSSGENPTLYGAVRSFLDEVVYTGGDDSPPLLERMRKSFDNQSPNLREASRNLYRDLLDWMREGSALRALLVISVGAIALLSLSGLLVFTIFFLIATINAIIISALVSLAAVGCFLAIFFACLTAFYIGALTLAIFVISATTMSMIIAVTVATGWAGFFWLLWLGLKRSTEVAKDLLGFMGSFLPKYPSSEECEDKSLTSVTSPLVEVKKLN